MNTLEQIENVVRQLSPKQLTAFRAWFTELRAALWDRQIDARDEFVC